MTDVELIERYRMPRNKILEVVDMIKTSIETPTFRSHAIPALLQVLVSLRYYAKGDFYSEVGDLHGISRASVSRCVMRVSHAIVRDIDNIKFPTTKAELSKIKKGFYNIAKVPNVIGAVDGTLIPIIAPKENEPVYVCRKGYHSLNIQAVVGHEMRFTNLVAKFPGSVHDSFMFCNSELGYFFEETQVDGWLLGDSGYALKGYLLTPKLNPSSPAEEKYNKAHAKTRTIVEQAFGVCKSRYRCLHKTGGCLPFTPERSAIVVTAVFKLHNKCIDDKLPLPDLIDEFIDNGDNHNVRDIAPANVQTLRERIIQRFA
ncbi:HARBI1 [Mytilus coruscus]|uniref:Putative nuclease HARBI1 n=1 Tax=Mytilus coruscus TaxID=42192 RepID=A0A6J8B151_MYTCO|nr:HARBI1 [Mytilus coruscus]